MKATTRMTALLLSLVLLAGIFTAAADPVVTRSYLTDTYQPYILQKTQEALNVAFSALEETLSETFSADGIRAQVGAGLWEKRMNGGTKSLADGSYTLADGAVISGSVGTTFSFVSGSAAVIAASGAALVDLTTGLDCANGASLEAGHCYIIADPAGVGIKGISSATIVVRGGAQLLGSAATATTSTNPSASDGTAQYLKYAQALQEMGLFRGTNNGFELTRAATRVEALVMLIRLLGEEDEALASTAKHPFKDVPAWADRYVAYGYDKGYTNGISKTAYGSTSDATREQYLTFLLRALGYDDAAGDFVWSKASEKAVEIGMLTSQELSAISGKFYRDQVTFASYKALLTPCKGLTVRLLDVLIDAGAVDLDAAYRATVIVG